METSLPDSGGMSSFLPSPTHDTQATWPWASWGLPVTSRVPLPRFPEFELHPGEEITTDADQPLEPDDSSTVVVSDSTTLSVAVVEVGDPVGDRVIVSHRWITEPGGLGRLRLIVSKGAP